MLNILDFPNEVLHQILSHVRDTHSLWALALVNRRLRSLTPEHLFHNVDLGRLRLKSVPWKTFDLFERSIKGKPCLRSHVHHLRVAWVDTYGWGIEFDRKHAEDCKRVDALLISLPNLQCLEIAADIGQTHHFDPGFLNLEPLPALQTVILSHQSTNVDDIVRFMVYGRIKCLRVKALEATAEQPIELNEIRSTADQLTSLDLGSTFHVHEDTLAKLLDLAPNLEELSLNIAGHEDRTGFGYVARPATSTFSPTVLINALEAIQHTLIKLRLTGCVGTHWPRHDRSRLDLSSFTALQQLAAPAICFFHTTGADRSRNGVFTLLPSTLRNLEVGEEVTEERTSTDCWPDIL